MKHISQIRKDLDVCAGLLSTASSLTDDQQAKKGVDDAARQLNTLSLDLSHYTFAEASTHISKAVDLLPKWDLLRSVKNGQQIYAICKAVTTLLN